MPPLAAASIGLGALQGLVGLAGLIKMSRTPMPNFTVSPELQAAKNRSSQMARMGFTPEQIAANRVNQATALSTFNRNVTDMSGGQMSRAFNNRGLMNVLTANNQFAVADANQMMNNIRYDDMMTNRIQQQLDRATQQEIQNRLNLERAYGGALQAGLNNAVSAINLNQSLNTYKDIYANKNKTVPDIFQINPKIISPIGSFGIDKPIDFEA